MIEATELGAPLTGLTILEPQVLQTAVGGANNAHIGLHQAID